METGITIGKQNMVSTLTSNPLADLIKPLKTEILLFESYVAGTSYIEDQDIFKDLKKGDTLILQREPENRFDGNAILVLDGQNRKLGYIPERDNIVFTRLMDAGKYLTAKVENVILDNTFRKINFSIYLVDF